MKILLFAIFILTFAHSKISNVDIYYEIKEKKRIEYLNNISKFTLRNVNNTMLDTSNILNSRNSKMSNIVEYYQEDGGLDREDIVTLNKLEEISLIIIEKNYSITCTSLVSSPFNDTDISLNECINLDLKLRSIYKTGVYAQNYFPNKYKVRDNYLYEIEMYSNISFSEKFAKIAVEDIQNIILIQNMKGQYIRKLCEKYGSRKNRTFMSKFRLTDSLYKRGLALKVSFNWTAKCFNYDFTKHLYTYALYLSQKPTGGQLNYIIFLLDSITKEIEELKTRIKKLNNLIAVDDAVLQNPNPSNLSVVLLAQIAEIIERKRIYADELDTISTQRNELVSLKNQLVEKKNELENL